MMDGPCLSSPAVTFPRSNRFTSMPNARLLFIALLLVQASTAQIIQRLDSLARHQQWVADVPGYAVAVLANNQLIFEKTIGVVNSNTGKSVDRQSDFHLASVSKPFAATAILQLCEQGLLHLDTALVNYLPGFTMKDQRYKNITLYHILTHSSGIPDVQDYEWSHPQTDDQSAARYAASFSESLLDFEPGTSFSYSNAAYDILAAVIQAVSGQSFEAYTRKNILLKAGMKKSSFLLSDISRDNFTQPHQLDALLNISPGPVYPYNRIHAPSSTLHSNLNDLLLWAQVFLQKGSIHDRQILHEGSWKRMISPQRKVGDRFQVCLSWFEIKIEGRSVYFHSGGDIGYRTFVGFCPTENSAVVLLGNNDLFDAAEAGFAYFETLFRGNLPTLPLKPAQLEWRKQILNGGLAAVQGRRKNMMSERPLRYDTSASSILELAGWLFERNHRQPAIDVLEWGATLYPNDGSWYGHLGDIHVVWKQYNTARTYYQKALLRMTPEQQAGIREKMAQLENQ